MQLGLTCSSVIPLQDASSFFSSAVTPPATKKNKNFAQDLQKKAENDDASVALALQMQEEEVYSELFSFWRYIIFYVCCAPFI
jgi:hypothetical protein